MVKNKKNLSKKQLLKWIGLTSALAIFLFSAMLIANAQKSENEKIETEKQTQVDKTNQKLKGMERTAENYEQYQKETQTEVPNKYGLRMSEEKMVDLYRQGYDYPDIAKADELSILSGIYPEEILKAKGQSKNTIEAQNEGSTSTETSSRSWEEVIQQFNIDTRSITEKLEMTSEDTQALKALGFNEKEILEAGTLAYNNGKTHAQVLKDLGKGKTIEELKKEYWLEPSAQSNSEPKSLNEMKEEIENVTRKQFSLTEEDILEGNKLGVTDIYDIGQAKNLAKKTGQSFEKVLSMKKEKKQWNEVKKELGVNTDEK